MAYRFAIIVSLACLSLSIAPAEAQTTSAGIQRSAERQLERVRQKEAGCRSGDAAACVTLGYWHVMSNGVDVDPEKAVGYYIRGCELGDAGGCGAAGSLYGGLFFGDAIRDYERAAHFHGLACEAGNATACYQLGVLYEDGNGVSADSGRAESLFARACRGGEGLACGKVANGDVDLLIRACDSEDWDACEEAAAMLANGQGTPQDLSRAAELFERLCGASAMQNQIVCGAAGENYAKTGEFEKALELLSRACVGLTGRYHPESCFALGNLYLNGEGTERSGLGALINFGYACDRGHGEACFNVGRLNSDLERKIQSFERSCSFGYPSGCGVLAEMYFSGRSVSRDVHRGVEYAERGCLLGSANSALVCFVAGRFLSSGPTEVRDRQRALFYFERAAELDPDDPRFQEALTQTRRANG